MEPEKRLVVAVVVAVMVAVAAVAVEAPRLPTPRDSLYHLCHCHIDQGSIY